MNDYQIAIPSYKRYETVCKKTLTYLVKTRVDLSKVTLFAADPIEAKHYREVLVLNGFGGIRVVPGVLGIGAQRNFIQRFYPEGTPVFSIDDDIECLYQRLDPKRIVPFLDLEGLIRMAFHTLQEAGLRLWGIHPLDNPFYMQSTVSYDLRYIIACCYGFIANQDERTFVQLEDKEDFERSLRYYLVDGGVVRFNWIGPKTRCYIEPGGMQVTRTPERVTASAKWLVKSFPGLCKINAGKKSKWTEVRLRDERSLQTKKPT